MNTQVYLYNLRILHHTLIVDIMTILAVHTKLPHTIVIDSPARLYWLEIVNRTATKDRTVEVTTTCYWERTLDQAQVYWNVHMHMSIMTERSMVSCKSAMQSQLLYSITFCIWIFAYKHIHIEDVNMLSELRVELLEVIINHCGPSIRSDDPVSLKLVVSTLNKRFNSLYSLL